MNEQDESATDQTEPDDIEYPDECPECGFEPADPNVMWAGSNESLAERAQKIDDAPLWRTTTSISGTGTGSVKVSCPNCGHVVGGVKLDDEIAEMVGMKDLDENE